jgi:ADP-ribose pyrophosphatase
LCYHLLGWEKRKTGIMKWTLKKVIKETDHPFLNFYTLDYDVEKEDGHHDYRYYMASRRDEKSLLPITHSRRADGILIPLYYVDPKTGEISIVITSQFRPPMGDYVNSFVAGLLDPGDKDLFDTARREAKEEIGAEITDLELLAPASPTSSGMSDEINACVLGRIVDFKDKKLEEFEDIGYKLVPLDKAVELLKDPKYFFPLQIRMVILYLSYRLKEQKK